jgi:hypothetical protein
VIGISVGIDKLDANLYKNFAIQCTLQLKSLHYSANNTSIVCNTLQTFNETYYWKTIGLNPSKMKNFRGMGDLGKMFGR